MASAIPSVYIERHASFFFPGQDPAPSDFLLASSFGGARSEHSFPFFVSGEVVLFLFFPVLVKDSLTKEEATLDPPVVLLRVVFIVSPLSILLTLLSLILLSPVSDPAFSLSCLHFLLSCGGDDLLRTPRPIFHKAGPGALMFFPQFVSCKPVIVHCRSGAVPSFRFPWVGNPAWT